MFDTGGASLMRGRLRRQLLSAVCWLSVLPSAAANQLSLVQTVDLHPYGYSDLGHDLSSALLSSANGQVAFLSNDCVAVSFLRENSAPQLSKRDQGHGGRFIFHTIFLNPITGMTLAERDWGTASSDSRLVPLTSNSFMVQGNGRAKATNIDGQEKWNFPLPRTDVWRGRPFGSLVTSQSGETIYIFSDRDKGSENVTAYESSGLRLRSQFIYRSPSTYTFGNASNQGVIIIDSMKAKAVGLQLNIVLLDGSSRIIAECNEGGWNCFRNSRFLTERKLLVNLPAQLQIVDTDGKQLATRRLDDEELETLSSSRAPSRVLALLAKKSRPPLLKDTFQKTLQRRLSLMNGESLSEEASWPLTPTTTIRGLAIDPSGTLIGYVENGSLRVLQLR